MCELTGTFPTYRPDSARLLFGFGFGLVAQHSASIWIFLQLLCPSTILSCLADLSPLIYSCTSLQRWTLVVCVQDKLKDIDKDLQGQMYSLEKQRLYCREVNGRISAVTAEVKTLRQMVGPKHITRFMF